MFGRAETMAYTLCCACKIGFACQTVLESDSRVDLQQRW
jgi:hypothetical protein